MNPVTAIGTEDVFSNPLKPACGKTEFASALLQADLQNKCMAEHFKHKQAVFREPVSFPLSPEILFQDPAPAISQKHGLADEQPAPHTSFFASLWPIAKKAAGFIGLDPLVLLAQVALETGWGQSMVKGSLNLFNIKARDSESHAVTAQTSEFYGSNPVKIQASFKKYASVEDSFADYIHLICTSPRYKMAMQNADNPEKYLSALQSAGYATDPHYADKILQIYKSQKLKSALSDLTAPI